jgi:heterodisulfide reductase subunit B
LGAEPVIYPYRNECCGGYISLEDNQLSAKKCEQISSSALENEADLLITACPLCMYNLDINTNKGQDKRLPILYFTELLAQVLDI